MGIGERRRETYVGDVFVAGPGGVLDQDAGLPLSLVGRGAHGFVVAAGDGRHSRAFVGDEAHRVWMRAGGHEDLDRQAEDASDTRDSPSVVAGRCCKEGDWVCFGRFLDRCEVGVKRQVQLLRDGAKGAPGGAEDLEGRDADAVAFFFDVDGGDSELFGDVVERYEPGGRVAGKLAMEGSDKIRGLTW